MDNQILTCDAISLLKNMIIPHYWDFRFDAEAVITVRDRGIEATLSEDLEDMYQLCYNEDSDSDDSDGFDERSR